MKHDPEKHFRQPNHSQHIHKIAAAVSPPDPAHEPTPHDPRDPASRPDKGRKSHALGEANPSGRGPHH
jgi:hypothetical protein